MMNDIELEKLSRRYVKVMLFLIVCIIVCSLVGLRKHWYSFYCIVVPFPMMLLAGAFVAVPKYPSKLMLTPVLLAVIVINVGGFVFYRHDWYVYSRIVLVTLCSIAIRYDVSSNHIDIEREQLKREEALKIRARQQARLDYDYERLVKK